MWPLAALVALCCLLAATYSVVVPPFEAPDEPGHYAYVEWLLDGHGIPLQGTEPLPLQPEFSQPPLYYLVEAPFAWLAGRQPANLPDWESRHNPFQNQTDFGNVNLYLHSPQEAFPWGGAVLGLHLMRLANVGFVALMVVAAYGCARELGFGRRLAWCAAAAVGLVPQVDFMGGVLNADNAIGSLSALSLLLLLRWLKRPSAAGALWLGLALGAAALSKLSGLVAVGVALAFMSLHALRWREKREVIGVLIAGAMAAATAGWWYVRNWISLGDPLGWNAMLPATGEMLRPTPLGFGSATLQLFHRWHTGLAAFGWANIGVHPGWYWLGLIGIWLGLVGLILRARNLTAEGSLKLAHWLLLAWPLAFVVSLARWVQVNTAADQWRLLFPAFPAFAVLLVAGWRNLLHARWQPLLTVPAGLLVLNIGSLAMVIAPAYRGLQTLRGTIEHPLDVRFGDTLQLLGYSGPRPVDTPTGGTVEVDLFWRADQSLSKNYATDLATIDGRGTVVWKELSVPDEGRAPMTAWPLGTTIVDRHRIGVPPKMVGAQSLLLSVIDPVPPGNHLPATAADGHGLPNDSVTVTRFLALPQTVPPPAVKDGVDVPDHLRLVGHTFSQDGGALYVTLNWKASATPSKDYTVFVHLVGPDGKLMAQHDGQPGSGAFPTSLLGPGVEVPDSHVLDVSQAPPGDYRLEVGLYDLASGARLGGTVTMPVHLS